MTNRKHSQGTGNPTSGVYAGIMDQLLETAKTADPATRDALFKRSEVLLSFSLSGIQGVASALFWATRCDYPGYEKFVEGSALALTVLIDAVETALRVKERME